MSCCTRELCPKRVAYNVTAWRCGGILCSFCRQLKPNKEIKFNGFYCCLIYNLKLELPMNSGLQLIAPTSCRHNAKPIVCVQRSCLCDESRSLDGRSGATFTIKPVVCCVALRSWVVNDATGVSVRAERIVKRLRGLDNCYRCKKKRCT